MRRTQSIEKETEKQWGKHKAKDTKERKIRWMQKEEKGKNRTPTNQPKAIHAYCTFYSFHLVYSTYYSSNHDQLVLPYTFVHSTDF